MQIAILLEINSLVYCELIRTNRPENLQHKPTLTYGTMLATNTVISGVNVVERQFGYSIS